MSNQVRLWFEADTDGTGELFAEASANGFSGVGSAWFNVEEIARFGETLSKAYPLHGSTPYKLEGGYWHKTLTGVLEQTHLSLRFYPIGSTGVVGCRVLLATPLLEHDRNEEQHTVALKIKTFYEELSAFGLALSALANGASSEATLYGAEV
jgi:hypothetical protein